MEIKVILNDEATEKLYKILKYEGLNENNINDLINDTIIEYYDEYY